MASKKEALKLPGQPKPAKASGKEKNQLGKQGEVITKLRKKEMKQLVGKGTYPINLDLSSTQFQLESDDCFCHVSNVLKELDLSGNQLLELISLTHLSKLKRLKADRNQISNFSFRGLLNAKTISAQQNRIEHLSSMDDLKKLVYLDLSGNRLVSNFSELAKPKTLRVLDLSKNSIDLSIEQFYHYVLVHLKKLPKLQYISFAENPIEVKIPSFRLFVIQELPKVQYLDWEPITKEERAKATQLDSLKKWSDKDLPLKPLPTGEGSPVQKRRSVVGAPASNSTNSLMPTTSGLSATSRNTEASQSPPSKRRDSTIIDEDGKSLKAIRLEALLDENEEIDLNEDHHETEDKGKAKRYSMDPLDAIMGGQGEDPLDNYLKNHHNQTNGRQNQVSDDPLDEILNYLEDPLNATFEDDGSIGSSEGGRSPRSPNAQSASGSQIITRRSSAAAATDVNYLDLLNDMITLDTPRGSSKGATSKSADEEAPSSSVKHTESQSPPQKRVSSPPSQKQASSPSQKQASSPPTQKQVSPPPIPHHPMDPISTSESSTPREIEPTAVSRGREDVNYLEMLYDMINDVDGAPQKAQSPQRLAPEDDEPPRPVYASLRGNETKRDPQVKVISDSDMFDSILEEIAAPTLAKPPSGVRSQRQSVQYGPGHMMLDQAISDLELVSGPPAPPSAAESSSELERTILALEKTSGLSPQKRRSTEIKKSPIGDRRSTEYTHALRKSIPLPTPQSDVNLYNAKTDEFKKAIEELEKATIAPHQDARRTIVVNPAKVSDLEKTIDELEKSLFVGGEKRNRLDDDDYSDMRKEFSASESGNRADLFEQVMRAVSPMASPEFERPPSPSKTANKRRSVGPSDEKSSLIAAEEKRIQELNERKRREETLISLNEELEDEKIQQEQDRLRREELADTNATPQQEKLREIQRKEILEILWNQEQRRDAPPPSSAEAMVSIQQKDIIQGERLGVGSYGTTYKAQWHDTSVTMKRLRFQRNDLQFNERLQVVVTHLLELEHPNLAKYIGLSVDVDPEIVCEWIAGQNLYTILRNPYTKVDHQQVITWGHQMAKALEYLHAQCTLHLGLKTKNILIDEENKVRIKDFGLLIAKEEVIRAGGIGTTEYNAPELLKQQLRFAESQNNDQPSLIHPKKKIDNDIKIDEAADVYSFGICLWECLSRQSPFDGMMPKQIIHSVLEDGARPQMPPKSPLVCTRLIDACWQADPAARPPIIKIVKILAQPFDQLIKYGLTPGPVVKEVPALPKEESGVEASPSEEDATASERSVPTQPTAASKKSAPKAVGKKFPVKTPPKPEAKATEVSINPEQALTAEEFQEKKISAVVSRILDLFLLPNEASHIKALIAVANLARNDANMAAMRKQGVIQKTIKSLSSKNEQVQEHAVRALSILAQDEDCSDDIRENAGIASLVALLRTPNNDNIMIQVCKTIAVLAQNGANTEDLAKEKTAIALVPALKRTQNDQLQLQAAWALSALLEMQTLSEEDEAEFDRLEGINGLLNLVSSTNPAVQLRALTALGQFPISGKCWTKIRSAGVIGKFIRLLNSKTPLLQQSAMKPVMKFSEQNDLLEEMESHGAMKSLLAILSSQNLFLVNSALRILTNFVTANQIYADNFRKYQGVETAITLLGVDNQEVLLNDLTLINAAILINDKNREALREFKGVSAVASKMKNPLEPIQKMTLSILYTLATDEKSVEIFSNTDGLLENILTLLESNDSTVVKQAVTLLYVSSNAKNIREEVRAKRGIEKLVNVLASNDPSTKNFAALSLAQLTDISENRLEIRDARGLYPLINWMISTESAVVQERILWSLSNFAMHNECATTLRQCGAIEAVLELLKSNDVSIQSLALKAILLLARQNENKRVIISLGGKAILNGLATGESSNATIQAAAAKALTFLYDVI